MKFKCVRIEERGHIFTERLLFARGEKFTMFLGSQVMANIINELIPNVDFKKRKIF